MTIPVELLFMFVFAHLLSAFLNHASHDLPSFLFLYDLGNDFTRIDGFVKSKSIVTPAEAGVQNILK